MAQKMSVALIDDIDGGPAVKTITFGLDGSDYEIDLNEENSTILYDRLGPFVAVARRIAGSKPRRKAASNGGPASADVKAWADQNGEAYPQRGRLPKALIEKYEAWLAQQAA